MAMIATAATMTSDSILGRAGMRPLCDGSEQRSKPCERPVRVELFRRSAPFQGSAVAREAGAFERPRAFGHRRHFLAVAVAVERDVAARRARLARADVERAG